MIIKTQRVEADENTSTVVVQVAEGDEKGTQCLGEYLVYHVTGRHKYRDLVLQVAGCTKE
jgi:hypothetical protein